jgi:hypothetical protein
MEAETRDRPECESPAFFAGALTRCRIIITMVHMRTASVPWLPRAGAHGQSYPACNGLGATREEIFYMHWTIIFEYDMWNQGCRASRTGTGNSCRHG